MDEAFRLRLLELQADLRARLRDVRDVRKAIVAALRSARELFGAAEAAAATLRPGAAKADIVFAIPRSGDWDADLLGQYIAKTRPSIPREVLVAPVERRGRNWAALALRHPGRHFAERDLEALFAVARILTDTVQAADEKRARSVRRKIEQRIADRQEPKDVIYDILHGLRSLTGYDHSAALLIARNGPGSLELVAEQIAWTKAKSKRIGSRFRLDDALAEQLRRGRACLCEPAGRTWRTARGDRLGGPPLVHGNGPPRGSRSPRRVSVLCVPITTPDGMFGVLQICARRRGVLGGYEAGLVEEFVPLASLAVQYWFRTEALHRRVLHAERKHALADLARGIAHDVNNALGAMLPLVQQLHEDVRGGRLRAATLREDIAFIEQSIQTCRRIFGGMLAIGRGSNRGVGHGNLRRAIDAALLVLQDSLRRRSIEVVRELPPELPAICGGQGDLTQLLLNICANARDAMPGGGALRIRAAVAPGTVSAEVADTGCGMRPEDLARASEPFFTTKPQGNGLGLAICRSVLWDIGGDMQIHSRQGEGTRVVLTLPVLEKAGGDPT